MRRRSGQGWPFSRDLATCGHHKHEVGTQREEGNVNPEETGEGLIKGRVDLTDTLRSPLGWARELRKNGERERERDESLR